jgi:hypothetical protein
MIQKGIYYNSSGKVEVIEEFVQNPITLETMVFYKKLDTSSFFVLPTAVFKKSWTLVDWSSEIELTDFQDIQRLRTRIYDLENHIREQNETIRKLCNEIDLEDLK